MVRISIVLVVLTLLAPLVDAAPGKRATSSSTVSQSIIASSTDTALSSTATVPFASLDPNLPLWNETSDPSVVSAERGKLGASVLGPDNLPIDLQNPDFLAPPTTDSGSISNAKWPFSFSHNRLQTGGWARQENIGVMPIATQMASVNMRLEPGAIRELHWHKTSEWAYVLKGSTQITAVDAEGRNYIATVGAGDLWYFPPGIPHSLQATADDAGGSEFILIFDDGAFSEDSTFLLTDWLAHVPMEVLERNFLFDNSQAFAHIPAQELYIFPSTPPADDASAPQSPQGTVPDPYSFALSKANATQLAGGSVKIVDSTTFTVSTTIAMAEVTVEPGAIRELHWHPTQDEWSLFLEGEGRVTIFASQGTARTFNYQPGDIGYVPTAMVGHYVENIGNTTLKFLEIFNTDRFEDISLNQWLALTPPDVVKAHLDFDDATIAQLSKTKPVVMGPGSSA
ncbi:oxalate decarboxylase [Armillaria gallica]|uniref:Oxalate decarboxylase n=1 Tax=Armillaria gallica TaxID=47427 RepID=A0A2H3E9K4_ARMGA|nr:oxalate decarboxylase [Armillaria gallica]